MTSSPDAPRRPMVEEERQTAEAVIRFLTVTHSGAIVALLALMGQVLGVAAATKWLLLPLALFSLGLTLVAAALWTEHARVIRRMLHSPGTPPLVLDFVARRLGVQREAVDKGMATVAASGGLLAAASLISLVLGMGSAFIVLAFVL